MFYSFDNKDIVYFITGFIFLMLTILPFLKGFKLFSAPVFFILFGLVLALFSSSLPMLDVQTNDYQRKIFEHFTEIIVIISLAGAGLAIDRKIGLKRWQHTWIMLFVVMPLTILSLFLLGMHFVGLTIGAAFLLASILAPTDPVLARSVQVDGPCKGEENDVNVSLTAEAGLNDGLAFPFIYLAILLAGTTSFAFNDFGPEFLKWFSYDFIYRVFVGVIIGIITGYILSKILMSKHGDVNKQGDNAGLILISSTFLSYGITEFVEGYGFLAVFVAAIVGKNHLFENNEGQYAQKPHFFSDQIEKIMMALLLLWIGFYVGSGALKGVSINEVLFALALLLIIRPGFGYVSLWFSNGSKLDHFAISFLGIRGIGSLYYLAYAQNHQSFDMIDSVWRICLLVILFSVIIHGIASNIIMQKIHDKNQALK